MHFFPSLAGYVEVIQSLAQVLAVLDCTHALASAAVSAPVPYVRPRLLARGSGVLKLEGMRHPCLEMQDEVSFIPNDCSFGSGKWRDFYLFIFVYFIYFSLSQYPFNVNLKKKKKN